MAKVQDTGSLNDKNIIFYKSFHSHLSKAKLFLNPVTYRYFKKIIIIMIMPSKIGVD